jgi:hypothetical protein
MFRALCRNRLLAAKRVNQWQNVSKSPRAARCYGRNRRVGICFRRRMRNVDANWAKRHEWMIPMSPALRQTCRSANSDRSSCDQSRARARKSKEQDEPFHGVGANRSVRTCQRARFFYKSPLHDVDLAGKFVFRQGLWIEGLQTPPGQECSNGSLILLAVVLWRTFLSGCGPRMGRTIRL